MTVVVALAVTGCGGGDDDDKAADADGARSAQEPATSAPATTTEDTEVPPEAETQEEEDGDAAPDTAEAGVPQASPGRGCLRGSYVSLAFVGKRSVNSPFGSVDLSGKGRGLELTFTRTRWVMRGVGRKPMRGQALGIDGTLKINGSARGRLIRAEGERIRFRQTGSRGTVKLTGLDQTFELPVSVVAPAVVPDGRATVTCSGPRLTIDSASGVLRLERR